MREQKEEEQEKESEPEFEYVSEGDSEDEKWDVESILTTQTDTGYRPAIISERKKKKPKAKEENIKQENTSKPSDEPHKIKLSRNGIPLEVFPLKDKKEPKNKKSGENKGQARLDSETPEQRKERKRLLKEQKKIARENKKNLKVAYKDEELKQKQLAQQQMSNLNVHSTKKIA